MLSGILGSALGFGGSIVPAITDHFKTKANNKFELKKMEKMAELRAAGFDHEMKMFETQAADNEHKRLIEHDISINQGVGIIAGLQKVCTTYHNVCILWIVLCNRSYVINGGSQSRFLYPRLTGYPMG